MNCCDPCDNGPADFTQPVIVPAGGTVTVPVPTMALEHCRRAISCVTINRNNNDINASLSPDRSGVAQVCDPLPDPIPESAVGPFLNPGVLNVPTYSTDLVLCNPGDDDVTVIVEWFGGCQCSSLCDPNQEAQPVEIVNDPLTVQEDLIESVGDQGQVLSGTAPVTITAGIISGIITNRANPFTDPTDTVTIEQSGSTVTLLPGETRAFDSMLPYTYPDIVIDNFAGSGAQVVEFSFNRP